MRGFARGFIISNDDNISQYFARISSRIAVVVRLGSFLAPDARGKTKIAKKKNLIVYKKNYVPTNYSVRPSSPNGKNVAGVRYFFFFVSLFVILLLYRSSSSSLSGRRIIIIIIAAHELGLLHRKKITKKKKCSFRGGRDNYYTRRYIYIYTHTHR